MAPAPHPKGLARAGWAVVAPSAGKQELPPELDNVGARLVSQVAKSWTSKYMFHIRQLGFDGQAAFHYECIFSSPANELPVPSFVLSTRWALLVPSPGADPRLFYSFEEGDLRHEWKLEKDSQGQFKAAGGQQYGSLGRDRFEDYVNRLLHEKELTRDRGVDMKTKFEETRLQQPPAYSEASSEEDAGSESSKANEEDEAQDTTGANDEQGETMREALKAAGLYCDKVEPPSSLASLLASIFDAADEENVGELPHYEVARLLSATLPGFGLELWDIHLLMTSAQENDDGFIECKPFIQSAPEIIQALCKRRMLYRTRGLPGVEIPVEAVKHCFTEEVTATAHQLTKVFEQMTQDNPACAKWSKYVKHDHHHHHMGAAVNAARPRLSSGDIMQPPTRSSMMIPGMQQEHNRPPLEHHTSVGNIQAEDSLVGVKRRACQDCISSLPERLSPQETMRLMQMLPEDEDGYIIIDELVEYLEHLRTDAMLNALVESDVLSLRTHLVLRFRRLGLGEDGKLSLWAIKDALLQADQVCLTRLQIHVLLCLATSDAFGIVDIAEFLGMCCVIIPHMFDAKLFVDTAEHLILEHAENMRRAENEELAALGAARVGAAGGDGEEAAATVEVDPETVERTLQQMLTLNDDQHRNPPALPPEKIWEILCVNEKEIQASQLSTYEITGFAAEMQSDEDGMVPYVEHIKKWVPIIFEQRKNRLLGRYMEESCYDTLGLAPPNLQQLEAMFPLLPYNQSLGKQTGSQRRSSRIRDRRDSFGSRRNSGASNVSHARNSGSADEGRTASKGSPDGRTNFQKQTSMHFRRVASNTLATAKTKDSHEGPSSKNISKEPPAGRGYERRKVLLAAAAAAEEAKAAFTSEGSIRPEKSEKWHSEGKTSH